jgi:hypothetical protein
MKGHGKGKSKEEATKEGQKREESVVEVHNRQFLNGQKCEREVLPLFSI